jgi:hypothetical protein
MIGKTKKEIEAMTDYPQGECGICQAPCNTCRKCTTPSALTSFESDHEDCDASKADPSANFCMSCNQQAFFPKKYDDIENVEDYFTQQRAMKKKELKPLSPEQKLWINQTWPEGIDIKKFMTSKISTAG